MITVYFDQQMLTLHFIGSRARRIQGSVRFHLWATTREFFMTAQKQIIRTDHPSSYSYIILVVVCVKGREEYPEHTCRWQPVVRAGRRGSPSPPGRPPSLSPWSSPQATGAGGPDAPAGPHLPVTTSLSSSGPHHAAYPILRSTSRCLSYTQVHITLPILCSGSHHAAYIIHRSTSCCLFYTQVHITLPILYSGPHHAAYIIHRSTSRCLSYTQVHNALPILHPGPLSLWKP